MAALRELGVTGAHPVPEPFTWREAVVDRLSIPRGGLVAVQEYGAPVLGLTDGLTERVFRVLRVPVYRWAVPEDPTRLREAAAALQGAAIEIAVFTNSAQVEHPFQVADDADALRAGLERAVVASVGAVCSEALEAHGIRPDLEASRRRWARSWRSSRSAREACWRPSAGRRMVKLKRVYDPLEKDDGRRILVERLWPRGIRKAERHRLLETLADEAP